MKPIPLRNAAFSDVALETLVQHFTLAEVAAFAAAREDVRGLLPEDEEPATARLEAVTVGPCTPTLHSAAGPVAPSPVQVRVTFVDEPATEAA